MRTTVSLLLAFACFLVVPLQTKSEDLIRVHTAVYELPHSIGKDASQAQLAKAAKALQSDPDTIRFEATSLVRSGSWLTARNNRILLAPSAYEKAKLYRGTNDKREYSIEDTGAANSSETFVLPSQATELKPIELGTTFHLKPSRLADDRISLEGSLTEIVLVDLRETNEKPIITVSHKQVPSKQIKITTDSRLMPVVESKKATFSGTRLASGETRYSILSVKPSCLSHPLPLLPKEPIKAAVTRVYSDPSQDGESVPVYPPQPNTTINLLVAVTPEMEKIPPSTDHQASGQKIHICSRFVELGNTIALDHMIFSEREFQTQIRSLSQEKSVDLLSAPSVITLSGLETSVQVTREFTYPNHYPAYHYDSKMKLSDGKFPVVPSEPEFEKKSLGAQLTVTPRVLSNGYIEMDSRCEASEFEGFIHASNPAVIVRLNPFGKPVPIVVTENKTLFALFSRREQTTTSLLSNDSTAAVVDFVDAKETRIKETGALGIRSNLYLDRKPRRLAVFVTAKRMK